MDNKDNFDMNDLDFNVEGHGGFQGNQNIMLGDPTPNLDDINNNINPINISNENNINSDNHFQEKPKSSFGEVNIPNSKDGNIEQNIVIKQEMEEEI